MIIEPEYQEALDYLYGYIDYSLTHSDRYSPEQFDLGRMHTLLASLGNPHRDYEILHVAGTKGKGSVCALCASALHMQGYRVGLYTSPHLTDFVERIQIDGLPISHDDFVALTNRIRPHVDQVPQLTTFEIATALAFWHFAIEEVEVAVVEVGLGGRLDSTNVCQPRVSVITALSLDHTKFLGETLEEIATEKAGIIKEGIPVVVAPQPPAARQTIARIAAEREAPHVQVGVDYRYKPLRHSLDGQTLLVWETNASEPTESPPPDATRLTIPLLGLHQVENAAVAYAALDTAQKAGLEVSQKAIQTGFAQTIWPARFEVLSRDPPIIIDSAHNPDSVRKLYRSLQAYLPGTAYLVIFGASEDKDVPGMLAALKPGVRAVVATRSTHPRSMDPAEVARLAEAQDIPVLIGETIEAALEIAITGVGQGEAIIVTGSIFVAAGARDVWNDPRRQGY